ncbi:MAG: hypothetical protein ACP5NW_00805 [Candidatus Woesearchaeota archaeon]
MNILSILGLDLFTNSDSRIEELAYEEYHSRYDKIKRYVEAIPEIKANINNVFCHEYLKQPINSNILLLGQGPKYSTYSIYARNVPDDDGVYLALRVRRIRKGDGRVHKIKLEHGMVDVQLFSELDSFYSAFANKINLPYFMGLVQWTGSGQYTDGVAGFITEDVTKRKTLKSRVHEELFMDTLRVTGNDGRVHTYFMNAIMSSNYDPRILKYGNDPIIVDARDYT